MTKFHITAQTMSRSRIADAPRGTAWVTDKVIEAADLTAACTQAWQWGEEIDFCYGLWVQPIDDQGRTNGARREVFYEGGDRSILAFCR